MPSRPLLVFILLLFAGMLTWQITRSISKAYSEKPQLKSALSEAVKDGVTQWQITANGLPLGEATTKVLPSATTAYVLSQQVILNGKLESFFGGLVAGLLKRTGIDVNKLNILINTTTEVFYTGSLRNVNLAFSIRPKVDVNPAQSEEPATNIEPATMQSSLVKLQINGKVNADEYLVFKGFAEVMGLGKFDINDYKIKFQATDLFLSSLSPTDCMPGLKPGMRWKVASLDAESILTSAFTKSKIDELMRGAVDTEKLMSSATTQSEVYVDEQLQEIEWQGIKVPCFLVVADNRSIKNRLWVHAETSRVLKQTTEWSGRRIEIIRQKAKEE